MDTQFRLVGVELCTRNLKRASAFYADVIGLPLAERDPRRFTRFATGDAFLCLERKGVEEYPSRDKAVVFLETPDLSAVVDRIGEARFVHIDRRAQPPWAVLHDPDGHNVVIVEKAQHKTAG